jgi:hypothetical protein
MQKPNATGKAGYASLVEKGKNKKGTIIAV